MDQDSYPPLSEPCLSPTLRRPTSSITRSGAISPQRGSSNSTQMGTDEDGGLAAADDGKARS